MFKIPEWEDAAPSLAISFHKDNPKTKKVRKQQNDTTSSRIKDINGNSSSHQNKVSKPQNKKEANKEIPLATTKKLTNTIRKNKLQSISILQNDKTKTLKKKKAKEITSSQHLLDNVKQTQDNNFDAGKDLHDSLDSDLNTDKLDEVIIDSKKRKLNTFKNKEEKDVEEMFAQNSKTDTKKKQILKNMLMKESNRNLIKANSNSLRERMLQRLKAAQFRYINEKLYTSSGSEAKNLFNADPAAFRTYHQGYQQQVKKWPVNPLDVIVKRIMKMPKTHLIADMGCGEAVLSQRVQNKVRSFDLVAFNSNVETCDIAHTPLLANSMDVAVYCLALMGSDLTQYLVEANRVLKNGGHLLIAEVESRFDNVNTFVSEVQKIGFSLKKLDDSNKVFYFMEFTKVREPPKKSKLPHLTLKPCLYKRR
ncbi:unnamed protein product [Leptosia nina]|uniref:Ribosomal RNA-processing protein 8 n=1 Tax=Leptosia nina TaxID=320188 RepID=A0AAV1JS15_9NEOP